MAKPETVTMGWDVGDRFTDVCAMGADGETILEQQRCVRRSTRWRSSWLAIRARWCRVPAPTCTERGTRFLRKSHSNNKLAREGGPAEKSSRFVI